MDFNVLVENMVIVDEHNGGNCNFEDDSKGGFDDNHMGLRVLI